MFITVLALATVFTSCKKENETPIEPLPDFMHLKVGNYWVYEFYKTDTNGIETKLQETDSAYILKDSILNGKTYFVKIQSPLHFNKNLSFGPNVYTETILIRDSSGYLVNEIGTILFAQENFNDILKTDTIPGLLWSETKMIGKDSLVTVPAGLFISRTICYTYYPLDSNYHWGIRKAYSVYGKNAGILKYTYGFYSSGVNYEARLLRYQ